jgi:micrococcal nuclease
MPCLASERQTTTVEKALSGDSVRLSTGKTLKYSGIQSQPMQSKIVMVREYGEKAQAFNAALVEGKEIEIEWGPRIRDQYGELIGYVFLPDGRLVNEEMLKAGWAKTRLRPPNLQYAERFRKAQNQAKRDKLGQWEKEPPSRFGPDAVFLGEKSTKIYYLPDSPELDQIPEAHLIKFRSRVEAKAAGYKACFTCKEEAPDPEE